MSRLALHRGTAPALVVVPWMLHTQRAVKAEVATYIKKMYGAAQLDFTEFCDTIDVKLIIARGGGSGLPGCGPDIGAAHAHRPAQVGWRWGV